LVITAQVGRNLSSKKSVPKASVALKVHNKLSPALEPPSIKTISDNPFAKRAQWVICVLIQLSRSVSLKIQTFHSTVME
jgi:hypothetical protein